MRPSPNGFGFRCESLYDAGLSASYMKSRLACVSSLTSRFGLVLSRVYWPVESGFELSLVNGLNHALSSVRIQLRPLAIAPVTMRVLFLAGPLVISTVKPMRSAGVTGLRFVPSAESKLTKVAVFRNVTWYTLPFDATLSPEFGAVNKVWIPGSAFSAFDTATLGASNASGAVVSAP